MDANRTNPEQTYFSDPTDPHSFSAPSDAPHTPDRGAAGSDPEPGSLPGSFSSVHPRQTTAHEGDPGSYRAFLISGIRKQVEAGAALYQYLDEYHGQANLERYRSCRSRAWFVRHRHTGEVRIASKRCHLRWCPLCQRVRRYIMTGSISAWLKDIQRPKFVTFTLKHREEPISHQIDRLYRSFRNLRRWKPLKQAMRGGVWFFQITKNEIDGKWHPHIHCLLDSDYIPHEMLEVAWETVTGDSYIVDIRAVKDVKDAADYVARYATSPCDMRKLGTVDLFELAQALFGRRICGKFGSAKNVQLSPKKCEDWFNWEDVGPFGFIRMNHHEDPVCMQIWHAWKSKTPCDVEPWWKPPPLAPPVDAECQEADTYNEIFLFD